MPTTTLKARSVSPALTVNDLPRSIRFYTEGLGFSVGEEWKEDGKLTGVMIHSEKVFLMLGQGDFAKGRDRVKGVGVRLYIQTDGDVNTLAAQAKAASPGSHAHGRPHCAPEQPADRIAPVASG